MLFNSLVLLGLGAVAQAKTKFLVSGFCIGWRCETAVLTTLYRVWQLLEGILAVR